MGEPSSDLHTRPSLLLRLRDLHDPDAWRLFTDTYAPLVYRYCRRQGLQEADAADVSQEVLAQVVRSIATFEYQPSKGRFRDWLGAVVRSKVARFRRKQAHSPDLDGGAEEVLENLPAAAADTEWEAQFNARVVRTALDRIRPDYDAVNWRAFEMVWLENRPSAEVACVLGMPVSAVYVAKGRVLRRLREEVLLLAEDVPHLVPLGDGSNGPRHGTLSRAGDPSAVPGRHPDRA
jgi:RNA polymerase sigma-70 factor (ECF subfamily)